MPESEVSRILKRIEQEYQASKRGLEGFASGTARHDFISRKTESISNYHQQLVELIGPEQAISIVASTIWTSADQGVTQ
jgi:hypothetical protein